MAQVLTGCLKRLGDLVARYGGEEFVIVMPGTDLKSASSMAETLRTKVEALGILHAKSTVSNWVTISLGVATTIPSSDSTPFNLVQASDQALYEAKHQGRNRIALAQG